MTVAFVRKAQALPGKEFEAVMWAKKIAELSAKIIGTAVTVRQQVGGPIGNISWITYHADLGAAQTALMKLLANEEFRNSVAKNASGLFAPGSGHDEFWLAT